MSGKPLVLLDVDGVLSLGITASSKFRASVLFHERQHWISGRAYGNQWGARIFVDRRYAPKVHSLVEAGAELVWATRWEDAANDCIAPLLGLPVLPVLSVNKSDGGDGLLPKAALVAPWAIAQGRPWAWLDDDEGELELAASMVRETAGAQPFLPARVLPPYGLHNDDVSKVLAWMSELA